MKLSVSHHFNSNKNARGFQKFGAMLLETLKYQFDVKLVKDGVNSDIHLTVISGQMKPHSKNVIRLDGVYYDIDRMNMNVPIKNSIKKADGVIFQSSWCREFSEQMLNVKSKRSVVIWNGCKQSVFENIEKYKHSYRKVFICCAHWRPNKRLKAIVESFLKIVDVHDNIALFVIGKPDYIVSHPRIHYFGDVKGEQLWSLYKSANYMIHICHIDACPNSVIEALSVGLPILCNNIGGTPEIVDYGDCCGVILELDKCFNFKPVKSMESVSSVDYGILSEGMSRMLRDFNGNLVKRSDLDIVVSARAYYEFFKKVLA